MKILHKTDTGKTICELEPFEVAVVEIPELLKELTASIRALEAKLAIPPGMMPAGKDKGAIVVPAATILTPTASRPTGTDGRTSKNVHIAVEVLRESGTPLRATDICEGMKQRGAVWAGKNPKQLVATMLSANRTFRNITRGMWCLRDEPEPVTETEKPEPTSYTDEAGVKVTVPPKHVDEKPAEPAPPPKPEPKPPPSLPTIAAQCIADAATPLCPRDVHERMKQAGAKWKGSGLASVQSMLKQSARFTEVGRGFWDIQRKHPLNLEEASEATKRARSRERTDELNAGTVPHHLSQEVHI